MTKKQTNTHYQTPSFVVFEALYSSMFCASTGGTVNDLTEDTTTLGGLFD